MGNMLLNEKKNTEDALKYFNKVLEYHPDNAVALANIGVAMTKQSNYDDAIIFFAKSIKADSKYANGYHGLALCYYNLQDYQKAFDISQDGLHKSVMSPENPNVYSQLCQLSINSAQHIVKNTDYSEVRNSIIDELEKNDHLPIEQKRDDSLPVSAELVYGPIHGQLKHVILYNPEKPYYDHLCIHELMHLKLLQRNTKEGKGKVYTQTNKQKRKFIARYHAFYNNLFKDQAKEQQEEFEQQICNVIAMQILNCPLDIFVEDLIYTHYPQLRPVQLLSLLAEEQDDINAAQPEVTRTFPKEVSHINKCMNVCKSLHFRQFYGINLLNRYHASKDEANIAKDLYDEYREYAKGFGPGEEYDLVQYFADTFGMSDYVTIQDEHKFMGEYEKKQQQNNDEHRDDYADIQNARYSLEHQDGADPQETLMMSMYMEVAMDHCDKIGPKGTQQLAMECARLGLGGINPSKEYTVHYVSDKQKLNGYQVIAFYYVSMARAFPKLLSEIGLPYTKAYEMALKKYNQKHSK
ncbi:tetratricopeptide repeat protein [Hallella multisaccharivorax]|nr:tetratricopeptide repeat protein [Hallella multisaccharivorax]